MFEYIEGKIIEINPAFAVIENSGIGYFIHLSLFSYSKLNEKTSCKLFVHEVIREENHTLYGFVTKSERELFRLLIAVSGIGANTARVILSSLTPDQVKKAILENDANKLKSVKGIGLKTAQRLIIELKDKLGKLEENPEIFTTVNNTLKEESLSALIMLGFPKKAVEKTIDKIISTNSNISVEELVKMALKMM
ncbi:MAG: Holliday junction branch migration protein RuvA [Bacteroidia bacterium]|nr:MAG: Holliday junction branch migration protein RuvA [Bacteroidia bacterium]PIE86474.1 MAG: Holliday junction branch migration protein RuvA [Bacteroidia bacterium]